MNQSLEFHAQNLSEAVELLSSKSRQALALPRDQPVFLTALAEYAQLFELCLQQGFLDLTGSSSDIADEMRRALEELAALHAEIVCVAESAMSQISLDLREFRAKSKGLLAYAGKSKAAGPIITSKKR